jgi:hypothetical protein
MNAAFEAHTALFQRAVIDVLPGISTHRLTRFFAENEPPAVMTRLTLTLRSPVVTNSLNKRSLNGRTRPSQRLRVAASFNPFYVRLFSYFSDFRSSLRSVSLAPSELPPSIRFKNLMSFHRP